ncbi:MAG: DUF2288 domain-containing protein [Gammaproteobacteria bacterium]
MGNFDEELRPRLNVETGKLAWHELERHFARGVVVKVSVDLDLVEIAASMSKDDKAAIERLIQADKLSRVSVEDAKDWHERKPTFWAVVVAPWVLVQEAKL